MGARVDTARVRVAGCAASVALVVLFGSVVLAACGSAAAPPPRQPQVGEATRPSGPSKCIADRTPARLVLSTVIDCAGAERDRCVAACDGGDGQACRALAHELEAGVDGDFDTQADADPEGAALLFARACHLGDASACTNYGAYLLYAAGGIDPDPACAARLHAMTCDAGDAWGCGMRGRELGNGLGVAQDVAAARTLLADSCKTYGGFPCDVLAELEAAAAAAAPTSGR
jgi:hypothetical protein